MPFIDPDNPLAVEIVQEASEAYFAACRKMVASLEALRVFERAAAPSAQEHEHVTRRSELVDDAAERVHFVLIQRDAMKLSWSEMFLDDYEVPAEVRARLGQRRREGLPAPPPPEQLLFANNEENAAAVDEAEQ
jgi:hypothetical protein